MRIASVSENLKLEKRIAISPEIAKKYISLGLEITLSESYGEHLGFKDNEFKELGVSFSNNPKEAISKADVIVQLGMPSEDIIPLIKENQTLIGVMDPYNNKEKHLIFWKKSMHFLTLILI